VSRILSAPGKGALRAAWEGWHPISPPMRKTTALRRTVEQGRQALGSPTPAAMWRSKYDMAADEFTKELIGWWARCGRST